MSGVLVMLGYGPLKSFGGGCVNTNVQYLVDIIVPPFSRPTVVVELLTVFRSLGSLRLV